MNKKALFIGLGIFGASIIALIILIMLFFSFLGKEKVSLSAEQFRELMEQKKFIITEATNQFSEYDWIKKVYIAVKDSNYQIEFYDINDEEYALQFYNYNKEILEDSMSGVKSSSSVNISNYSKYTAKSSGKYSVVSRINNTVIYIDANSEYEEEINSILKELGY